MSEITPLEDVASEEGVFPSRVAKYQEIETRLGTGLLPPSVWASEIGDTTYPSSADLVNAGLMPGATITWLLYEELRRATAS